MEKEILYQILQRLTTVETLLQNHLATADRLVNYLYFPTLVGVILIMIKVFFFPTKGKGG
jgi:hypothetical protein